jgi:hypothetical protein
MVPWRLILALRRLTLEPMKTQPGAVEAHPRAMEAHSGPMETHPRTMGLTWTIFSFSAAEASTFWWLKGRRNDFIKKILQTLVSDHTHMNFARKKFDGEKIRHKWVNLCLNNPRDQMPVRTSIM